MQPRSRLIRTVDRKASRSVEEYSQLLLPLKNTVEGLLAYCTTNVWNTYGGLSRLCGDIEKILNHKLRTSEGIFDYWQFLCGVKWLKPTLSPPSLTENLPNINIDSEYSEGHKWLKSSLQEFILSSQLEVLTSAKEYLLSFYDDEAFLCNKAYTQALLICLKAVEQNKPSLLAELDPTLVVKQAGYANNTELNKKRRKNSANDSNNNCGGQNRTFNFVHSTKPYNMDRSISPEMDETIVQMPSSQHSAMGSDMLSSTTCGSSSQQSEINLAGKRKKTVKARRCKNVRNCKVNNEIFISTPKLRDKNIDKFRNYKIVTAPSSALTLNRWRGKRRFPHGRHVKKNKIAAVTQSAVDFDYLNYSLDSSQSTQESLNSNLETFKSTLCKHSSAEQCYTVPHIKLSQLNLHKNGNGFGSCPDLRKISTLPLLRCRSLDNIFDNTWSCRMKFSCTDMQGLDKSTGNDTDSEFHTCDEAFREMTSSVQLLPDSPKKSENHETPSHLEMKQANTVEAGSNVNEKDSFSPKRQITSTCSSVGRLTPPLISNEKTAWKAQHTRSRSDVPRLSHSPLPVGTDHIDGRAITPPPLSSSLPCSLAERHRKSLIEDDSPIVVPTECFFPRPHQGQSLTSFLSSKDFTTCAELDKENAHFCISEALISAIEQMKCNRSLKKLEEEEDDSDEVIMELKQKIRIRRRERQQEKTRSRAIALLSDGKTETTSPSASSPFSSTHSSASGLADSSGTEDDVEELELSDPNESKLMSLKENGLSLSMASLYSDADIQPVPVSVGIKSQINEDLSRSLSFEPLSAETVALCLLKKFSEKQLPKASELEWLVSEQDAPQRLLPLPDSWPVSPDIVEEEYSLEKTRLRGNLEWAPPRAQIIFNIHPPPKRKVVIAKQNYRCAGCGMKIDRNYINRFRYCEYLGKYFCQCCHSNSLAYIPARILRKWDFTKHYVSKFSRDLLDRMFGDPLFNVLDLNNTLYRKVRQMDIVREYRVQLLYIRDFINTCRKADRLKDELSQEPSHLINEPHMYSLYDLLQVKNGDLAQHLCHLVLVCVDHIKDCPFCQAKGFICEVCNNGNDVIFPFQLGKVLQCQDCGSCFHKKCYIPKKCPRCARIEARRRKMEEESHHYSSEEDN